LRFGADIVAFFRLSMSNAIRASDLAEGRTEQIDQKDSDDARGQEPL
jgi:hypothetical protein